MNAAGLLTLMLMTLGSDSWPEKLNLKRVTISCKDISAINSKDGYRYVGISANKTDYMSDYSNVDELQDEVDRQCGRGK